MDNNRNTVVTTISSKQADDDTKEPKRHTSGGKEPRKPSSRGKEPRKPSSGGNEQRKPSSGGKESRKPSSGGNLQRKPSSGGNEQRKPCSGGKEPRNPSSVGKEPRKLSSGEKEPRKPNSGGKERKKSKQTKEESHDMSAKCAKIPKVGILDSIPCCKTLHDKFCFKVFVFLTVLCLDAADLISDWLLFRDVVATEEGLVYGPVEDSIKYSLLTFSIVGTLAFSFEIPNLWWEIFRNNPWLDVDLLSAITIWIADVPQITINILIAVCREGAISYFQLVQASVIIFGSVIRVIVCLVLHCNRRARLDIECASENPESRRRVVYRLFLMLGLILTLGGAISVFLFTQSERNIDGSINFNVPHTVVQGEYDDKKYFHNVSLYFSHEVFDYNSPISSDAEVNLVRMALIYDIRNENVDGTVKIQYDQLASDPKVVIWLSDTAGTLQIRECFQVKRSTKTIDLGGTSSACTTYLTGSSSEIIFRFHYVKPEVPGLVFGDIKYNQCNTPSFVIEDIIQKRVDNPKNAFMHYFRTNDGVSEINHVIHTSAVAGRFYQISDLTDITSVWVTGFSYCKSSGSLAPHEDSSISCP